MGGNMHQILHRLIGPKFWCSSLVRQRPKPTQSRRSPGGAAREGRKGLGLGGVVGLCYLLEWVGQAWPKLGKLLRYLRPTSSASVGSQARMKTVRLRG